MSSLKHILLKGTPQFNFYRRLSTNILNEKSNEHFNIIIVGGGIVGTSLACTLGKNKKLSNQKIMLLESSKSKPYTVSDKYSNRVVSLNPGTKNLLNDIGAWKHIESFRFGTVKRLQVMDAISDASITFGNECSSEDVSYIVENDLLIEALRKEVQTIDNVQVLYENKVKEYNLPCLPEKYVHICLENGKQYSCDLLIGCDGYNSQVRKAMGVHYLNWNYDSTAVVGTIKFSEEISNHVAWQRFLPTGPVALLPLNKSMSSLVWSTTKKHAQELLKMSNEQFIDSLNEAFWKVYQRQSLIDQAVKGFDSLLRAANIPMDVTRSYPPKIVSVEENSRACFPLGFGHASSYIAPGVSLVGDAAHRIHPLAGQGVNLGFGDIACLNRVLSEAVYSGAPLGSVSFLRDFETERQKYNVLMLMAVEGLFRVYTTDITPIVLMRSIGLQGTDVMTPLKKLIWRQASL